MNTRITKTMKNNDIISLLKGETPANGCSVEMLVEYLNTENERLAKRSHTERKPTKNQLDNEEIKNQILEYLISCTGGQTCTDVMVACGLHSTQKAAALLNSMVNAGRICKSVQKGKALFSYLEID